MCIRDSASGTITENKWHHIVVTWTDGTGAKLYIDGSLAQAVSSSETRNKNGINLALGGFGHNRSGQANFKGLLDTHRYFNSELSASQVTQLFSEKGETDTSNFKAVLYEGTAANQYISNVGIDLETSGGLVWIKNRSNSSNYFHALIDSVRGVGKVLSSNTATADTTTYTDQLTSLEANGFFVGNNSSGGNYVNLSGDDYVAWNWKGGGDAVTIAVNSITGSTPSVASDVSANTNGGFSIVKFTGDGTTSQTVAHGLSSAPELVIMKDISGNNPWYVLTTVYSAINPAYLQLETTAQAISGTFTSTASTFTNFAYGSDVIAYCFHSVSGFSKIGTYSGTGSSGNTAITGLGFTPSFFAFTATRFVVPWSSITISIKT